jgi:ABC-type multidrug transport system fused ATPase/permease subunit
MAAIIYIAALQVKNNQINIGTITSFLFYMVLLLVNFGIIAGVFGNVMAIFGASDKIIQLMAHKSKVNTEGGLKLDES